jgi:hypothetical protein
LLCAGDVVNVIGEKAMPRQHQKMDVHSPPSLDGLCDKPRFLLGVLPGVNGICTELGAGLTAGSSSCNAVNGFRFFAARRRRRTEMIPGQAKDSVRVRCVEPGVCLAGVRRCFEGVPFDFDGVVI